ncbi:conjugal transfer protein TrbC, partial [Mesorhizobium sp. M00.F.Ca.ET.149.01.1.1]
IAGGMLIFGGELNDFARRLCYIALVGGVLLGATQIVGLFGATGATIGEERPGTKTVDHSVTVGLRPQGEGAQ